MILDRQNTVHCAQISLQRDLDKMGLEDDFQQAVDEVSNKINKSMSNDELKEIYAFYKQGTVGDINTTRPGMLDLKVFQIICKLGSFCSAWSKAKA